MAEFVTAFAVLAASDLARARAWYADKLGLQPVMSLEDMGTDIYVIHGTQVTIYETPSAGTARSTALGLVVNDLRGTMAELRSRGVVFEEYDIQDGPKTVDGVSGDEASGMAAWFTDSEGNIVNLVQLPPGFPLP
jgi:catechol 2,3-dioxygenase-like lactoylglutathione lyase family enzyme